MSVELYSGSTSHKQKIPESMIQKKRELHLSYSQAFGVALPTDKFSPRYSAGIHLFYVGNTSFNRQISRVFRIS